MRKVGYVLIDNLASTVVARFDDAPTDTNGRPLLKFVVPGTTNTVHSPLPGEVFDNRYRFAERLTADPPSYNPETERLVGPVESVVRGRAELLYSLVALSAQEIEQRKNIRLEKIDLLNLEMLFRMENRIRALEGKQPITRATFKAAVKAFLATFEADWRDVG